MTPLSIYIHVPFCSRKCDYCHFYVIPYKKEWVSFYLKGLGLDIALAKEIFASHKIVSIYFGGGTPSLLTAEEIAEILTTFHPYIDSSVEITLEGNPESITKDKVEKLRTIGINRISIGVQSFHNEDLVLLSRQHGASIAEKAIRAVYEGGIENISIDLMYDLPGQSEESFMKSLSKATELPITHLSLYNLTFEPHTVYYKKRKLLQSLVPNEEMSLALLTTAIDHLEKHGLHRYEISAFAKRGFESIHNSGYWTGREYLGFGPSAHSYYQGERSRKEANFHRWKSALFEKRSPLDFSEKLSPSAAVKERLAIGLRLFHGVSVTEESYSPELTKLEREGLVVLSEGRVFLTDQGKLFYDYVAETLIEV